MSLSEISRLFIVTILNISLINVVAGRYSVIVRVNSVANFDE